MGAKIRVGAFGASDRSLGKGDQSFELTGPVSQDAFAGETNPVRTL